MSSYFRNWIFLPNDSRWALQWSSACGRTQTTGRLRAQLCKCCADFKGNHHVCGHGRSSVSLAGRSCLATGTTFQLYSSTRAWEILWQHRAGASSLGKILGVQRGSCVCNGSDMNAITYPYLYPYSLEFLGLAVHTMGHWESGSKGNSARVEELQPRGFREEPYQPCREADIGLHINLTVQ